jgi:hypothetical protein
MTAESNAQDARKAAERMAKQAAQTASQTASRAKSASAHSHDTPDAPAPSKSESHEHASPAELRKAAQDARADLASTLDAIEFKFNVPKQVKLKTRRANDAMKRLGEDSPPALLGIALGAAAIVGTAVWLGARAFQRR